MGTGTDAIVVGAGPAGAAAAIGLAHGGAKVLLLERARETGDALETKVAAKYWPYPTYGEMLFSVK